MSRRLDEKWKSWFADWKAGLAFQSYGAVFWIQHWQDAEAACRLVDKMYKAVKGHTHEVSGSPLSCVFLKGLTFVEMIDDGCFWVFNMRREWRASMSILKSLILWRGLVGNIWVERCVSFQVWLTEHKASEQPSTVTTIIITTSATSHQRATSCYNLPTLHRQEKPRRLSSIHRHLKLSLQRQR